MGAELEVWLAWVIATVVELGGGEGEVVIKVAGVGVVGGDVLEGRGVGDGRLGLLSGLGAVVRAVEGGGAGREGGC